MRPTLLIAVFTAAAAFAAEPKQSLADKNKAVVERFENEFKNKENLGIVDELMSPDFVHVFPDPNAPPGRDGLKAQGKLFFGGFPHSDLTTKIEQIMTDGDKVITQSRVKAVHKGVFAGMPATGKTVTWTEINIYTVKDGKIVHLFSMPNLMGIVKQIAPEPKPAAKG